MGRTITVDELSTNMDDILRQAKDEDILIKTSEGNTVVIIALKEYEELLRLKKEAERSKRFALLRQAAEENAKFNKLTEEEAYKLVEQVREEIYQEKVKAVKEGEEQ